MIAIIGAMQEEIELLVAQLETQEQKNIQGFEFFVGTFKDAPVVILQSGIGKVSAALGVAVLQEHFQPDCVINTGSAAGLKPDMAVGDVVISSEVAYYDVDVTAFGYVLGQVPKMPATFHAEQYLIDHATKAYTSGKAHVGLVVSGDSFIDKDDKLKQISQQFKDALALEMEAGAIAQACYMLNLPFVVVRSVSDVADNDAKVAHEKFLALAAKKSSELVIGMLNAMS